MRPYLLVVVTALLTTSAAAQTLPSFRQGMPYGKARAAVIAKGWQAVVENTNKRDLQRSLQEWFIKKGFLEVEACMPTGLGLCSAVFHNASGRRLYLTTGEAGDTEPNLVGWCLDKPDCTTRRR